MTDYYFVAFRVPCKNDTRKSAFTRQLVHDGIALPYVFTLPCGVATVSETPSRDVKCDCGNHLVVEFDDRITVPQDGVPRV